MPKTSTGAASARLAWIAATKRSKEVRRDIAPIKRMLRAYIVTTFGESSALLADFGMAPRAARHTMGKRQRQGVVGRPSPIDPATPSATTKGGGTKLPLPAP